MESSSSLEQKGEALGVSTFQLDFLIIIYIFHQGINEIVDSPIKTEFLCVPSSQTTAPWSEHSTWFWLHILQLTPHFLHACTQEPSKTSRGFYIRMKVQKALFQNLWIRSLDQVARDFKATISKIHVKSSTVKKQTSILPKGYSVTNLRIGSQFLNWYYSCAKGHFVAKHHYTVSNLTRNKGDFPRVETSFNIWKTRVFLKRQTHCSSPFSFSWYLAWRQREQRLPKHWEKTPGLKHWTSFPPFFFPVGMASLIRWMEVSILH